MDVLGKPGSEPVRRLIDLRAEDELAGAGQQTDRAQGVGHVVGVQNRRAADDLGRDLRHAVAEVVERQQLEDEVAGAAIGRDVAGPLDALDPPVGRLALGSVVEASGILAEVELVAVGPDAAEGDIVAAFAKCHREGQFEGRHLGRRAEPLAGTALSLLARLDRLELRAPDDVAAEPHPPPELADGRALFGVGDRHLVTLRRPIAARGEGVRQDPVDDPAADRAERPADEASDGSAERRADGRAGGTEDERGHGGIRGGEEEAGRAKTGRRRIASVQPRERVP